MYFLFFILWIIFNGRITPEITVFGLVISAALYCFLCKFMEFSPQKELMYLKKSGLLIQYMYHLVREIVLANFAAMSLICSSSRVVEPVLVEFDTNFKTDAAKFMLANSITLTPGTITVAIDGDRFTVHCLDKSMAEGMETSVFVKLLKKIET